MPARKIDFYLNSADNLRPLTDQARRLAELQQVFLKTAPQPLTHSSCVKQLRAGTLFLLAGNAAVAAKLKQLAPRLLTAYEKLGFEVTSIRVEVQVEQPAAELTKSFRINHLSIESIEHLEKLAAQLEDTPLKQALATMAQRQRKLRSRSKH